MQTQQAQQSAQRLQTTIALQEPDRVPFVPKMSGFYMNGYNTTFYDAMKDPRNMEAGFRGFMRDYQPDAVNIGGLYDMDALEVLGTTYMRWPGPTCGLPLDSSFQHLESEFLQDEEYEDFLADPTHTMLTKLLPRKYDALKGLSKLYLRETSDAGFFAELSQFNDPVVQQALFALMEAGKACAKRAERMTDVRRWIVEEGYTSWCQGTFLIPFDAFADSVRGILRTVMDCIEYPDELHAAVQRIGDMNVERLVKKFKAQGATRIFLPLHCGVDEFMSPANYEKFYWPSLKRCIDTIIQHDMTPVCFCEGNYNTRLETLCDVPTGKVIYMFEKIDIARAKQTVGKIATICGSVPNALLAFGTQEQVIEETKRQIDILAPGGGFIMDCSIMLDNAKHENMMAWKETTLTYGKY